MENLSNSAPYPMGTSCNTHGTAVESCWWHTPFHWTPPCWHEWLCVAMLGWENGFFYHTPNMCSYTCVCCADAPPVPSVTKPQVHTALPSPSSLLVVLVLKAQDRLPGTLKTVGLPHTHIWKLWFVCSVTCQHTNKQLFKTFSFVFNLKLLHCYKCPPSDPTWALQFLNYVLVIIIPSTPWSSILSISMTGPCHGSGS